MSSLFMRPVRAIFVCLLPHYETSEYTNIILKYIQPAILDYIANQGYLQVFLSIIQLIILQLYQQVLFPVRILVLARIFQRTWSSYHDPVFWNAGLLHILTFRKAEHIHESFYHRRYRPYLRYVHDGS